ncbi:peptidyl-prolyl cis-trans isomerase sig-7 [Halyomorpha halys]|uniref:peptidyl-prolyl cis-trans isomerase sig-7 n=1 Tax=Halyomorpha halys TaxID=286706 RepID=UPI0006D52640|nr:peptidyl-prolyl cis-trans isomerase sig-7 [Halyomorpha halys]XP_014284569.1 peptidyl-prolyl cis-trans isomerase sig-7 [Halyomorpha halys]XP_014284570.1 peptidyl-prolyl cis-trans isomerase sig-7 [Halyomorpha halys]XP_024214238.1 peptidyl-prolyl cis-trans isomerase sig-7 [Halyomorpha halys]
MAVVIETTLGDITVDLFTEERPQTCKNFLKLCKVKYYNFCLFHTIQPNFIAQTGDPTGIGNGGESVFGLVYGEESKYYEAEKMPKIKHTKPGLLSMVNYGNNMLGSQFFVTLGTELKSLEEHCVFAEVTEGHDILIKLNDAICDNQHRPYQDIRITHTVILEDPFDDLPGLVIPDASPDLSAIQASNGRIGADEKINDEEGLSEVQLQEIKADREAKARATILEIVGDLPHAEVAPPENVLFVCKLNPVTTDEDLEILFGRFGKVKSCEVIRDHQTGDSLQYAFVEFEDQKSCEQAYLKMDNVLIDDRRIHVDFSQSVSKIKWRGKGLGVQYIEKPEEKENSRSVDRHSSKKDYYRERERDRDRERNDRRRDDDRRRRVDRDADDYRRRERRKGDDSRRREDESWRERGEEDNRYDEDRKRRELREERRREEERKYSSRREERSRRDDDRRRDGDKRRNGADKKESTSSRRGEHHNDDKKIEKAESSRSRDAHETKDESKQDSSRHNKEKIDKIDSKIKDLAPSSNSHSKVKEEVVQKEDIEPKNNSEEAQPKVAVETDRSLLDSSIENMTPEKGSTSAMKDKKKKKRKPSTSSDSSSSDTVDSSSSSSSLDQKRKRKHNVTVAKKYYHRGKLVKIIKKKKNDSSDSESSEESSDSDRKRRKTKYKKIVKVIKKRRRTSTDDSDSDTSSSEDTDSSRPRKKKRKNDKNLKKKKKDSKKRKKKKNDPSESSLSEDDKLKRKGKSIDVKKQKKELSD